ncbi:MAG: tyrosine-type recombinase/integrase [Desulfomonilaceae bacterium]
MAVKKSVVKYVGVYYTESTTRKWRGRPDRVYWVNFRDTRTGKLQWERCGWLSGGWTPEAAQNRRHEILQEKLVGRYRPKQQRKNEQITFDEFMNQHYLPWGDSNKKRAPEDRSLYKTWLKSRFGGKKLQEISSEDLENMKKEMRELGKAEATVKHALCLVRQAFNKATAWGKWNGENPCKSVGFPKPNNQRLRFLSAQEADKLLVGLRERSTQLADVSLFGLLTGCRLREIFGLTWSNIDLTHGYLTVLDSKKGEPRHIPLTAPIRELIQGLPKGNPDDTLFKNSKGERIGWLSKKFKSVVDSIGLNKGITDSRQKLTFHTLRHTYASWAVMKGVPLYIVGQAMGHKTLTMTARYSHLAPGSLDEAFQAVSDFRNEASAKITSNTYAEE